MAKFIDLDTGLPALLNKVKTWVNSKTENFITAEDAAGIVAATGDLVIVERDNYIDILITESQVNITPASLALYAAQKSAVIKVSGTHLKNDISISVPTGFTATPSTIAQVGGTVAQTDVTIAYTGADASTASGNITATAGDVVKSIPVAYSQYAGPTILADNTLTIKAAAGQSNTGTLQVTGLNLTAGINATVSGTGFTVSSSENGTYGSSASLPSSGGTLYVKFSPTGSTGSTGTLTLASTGATSKTVDVTGAVSTITVSVNSLSLSTDQGGSATGTFTVEGANLNEDISIVASGTGFSVSPNTIAHSNGSVASTTVTVTYSPSTAGTHTGEVTIQSSGVSKTVTLQGTVVETPNFTSENNYRLQVNGIYYDVMMSNNAPTTDLRVNNSSYSGNAAANSYSGDVVIPSTISGKLDGVATTFTVKDIRTNAFSSCNSLNSVVVPDSVTAIHDYAFYNSALKRLVIGNGVAGFTIGSTNYVYVIGGRTVLDVADFGTAFMDFGPLTSNNQVKMSANGKVYMRWTGSRESGGNTYYHAKAEGKPFRDTSGNLPSTATLYVPSGKVSNYQGSSDWAAMFSQGNILAIDE